MKHLKFLKKVCRVSYKFSRLFLPKKKIIIVKLMLLFQKEFYWLYVANKTKCLSFKMKRKAFNGLQCCCNSYDFMPLSESFISNSKS